MTCKQDVRGSKATAEPITLEDYRAKAGQDLGVSRWIELGQDRIDGFADLTEDWQFLHVDPEAAAKTPFGGTIAHGYLTLSMLSTMAYEVVPVVIGTSMGLNYGFNKLRFLSPVRSGKRVRGRFKLLEVSDHASGGIQNQFAVTVEIEGEDRPALMAEWITLIYISG